MLLLGEKLHFAACFIYGYNYPPQYNRRNLGLRRFVQNFNLNTSRSWYNIKVVSTTITNRIVNYELFYVVVAIF